MPEKSLRQKTISGMIWVGFQKFGTLTISFLSNIILARLLTPDDYGIIGMLAIFIAVSNSFIDGGFGSALIQKTKPTQEDYSTVFYWNIFVSILLYLLLYACAPFIEHFYKNIHGLSHVLRIQGLILIINAFSIIQVNQLKKSMQFKILARNNVASALISVIFAIILAYYGFGVWALVFQQILFSLSNCIILWVSCKWKPEWSFSFDSLKQLFGFGSYIMMSSLVNTLGVNINGLIIGRFFSAGTLGYYTQAKKLEDVSSVGLLTVVEQVTYPMLVEVKDDFTKIVHVLEKFNCALLSITMPLLYLLVLIANPVIVILFSEKWLPSAPILQILAIHGIFITMQGANYNAIAAVGLSKVLFQWTIIKRITGIVILFILLYLFGFNGLLWGVVISALVIVICNMYLLDRYISYKFINQIKSLIPVILITTLPFIITLIVEISICKNIWYHLICGLSYIFIYIAVLFYMPINYIKTLRANLMLIIQRKKFA